MLNKDYNKKILEELNLFKNACPHFDKLQKTVGRIIKKQFKNSNHKTLNLIEIGCGTGNTTKILLACDKRISVTAIDIDNNALKYSKSILKDYTKKKRVEFLTRDALRFLKSCKDTSFDIFTSVFTLHNFKKEYRNKLLRQISRVLKKEGLFINGDKYARENSAEQTKNLNHQLNKFKIFDKKNRPDLKKKWIKHYLKDEKVDIIMREKESIEKMKSEGFKNIRIIYRRGMESILVAKKS
ncbi:MAG: class I SAM-dependent methyltransferase [Nanoarchaeota archaeon]|nr:class I SAM-dependent methyltransferase [Nanoarchaeota archaeon]